MGVYRWLFVHRDNQPPGLFSSCRVNPYKPTFLDESLSVFSLSMQTDDFPSIELEPSALDTADCLLGDSNAMSSWKSENLSGVPNRQFGRTRIFSCVCRLLPVVHENNFIFCGSLTKVLPLCLRCLGSDRVRDE